MGKNLVLKEAQRRNGMKSLASFARSFRLVACLLTQEILGYAILLQTPSTNAVELWHQALVHR